MVTMALKWFCLGIAHFLKNSIKIQDFYRWRATTSIQATMDLPSLIPFHNLLARYFELDAVWNVFWQVLFPKYLKVSVFQIKCNAFQFYLFLLFFWQKCMVYFNKNARRNLILKNYSLHPSTQYVSPNVFCQHKNILWALS